MPDDKTVRLGAADNLLVACRHLARGDLVQDGDREFLVAEPIVQGHKVCARAIARGEPLRKYGQIIGFATRDIGVGEHVHVHNCSAEAFERDYAHASCTPPTPPPEPARKFQGIQRADGRIGTRNYLAVISTVNCSASTSKAICARFPRGELARYETVDGLLPLVHKAGCAMQFGGEDHRQLNRVLAGFARHPNVGGALVVGLGCETGQASYLVESERLVQVERVGGGRGDGAGSPDNSALPVLSIQEAGGIEQTVDAGIAALRELLPRVADVERSEQPASKLILGTQCGGSDGSSGVTANPALGIASDRLVAQGGTTVLGETPEIYGAEHLLTRRAINTAVGERLVERIRWWEWYTGVFGCEIDNNPSPGNKAGGLTTIYEKSLGAVAKAGSTALRHVYEYAEPIKEIGFVIMDTPGYDPASLTGIVAGGANVCVFTTGRGSVYGCKPAPCIKVATHSPLYQRMQSDMDIDAGVIYDGTPVAEVGERIFEEILEVASGKKTKSELAGVGEEEFSPWSIGPVL